MLRFGIVGLANTLIDLLTLNLLLWRSPAHNASLLLMYNSIAFLAASLNSFVWNKYWTFRRRQVATPIEIARFATVAIAGFFCNDALVWTVGSMLHPLITNSFLWANLAKLSATAGTMLVTYLGMRLWVFAGDPYTNSR
jgi:putative flippase GtrA